MSSLAENKFLIGYGIVVALAVGSLGYLTLKEKGAYQTALKDFDSTVANYNGLRSKPLALTKENLEKLEGQTRVVTETAIALRDQLAARNLPLEPITPTAFQDLLRARVSDIIQKAEKEGVALPKDFYLGFEQYQSQPPRNEAAAVLLRQLKVIEQTFQILIDNKVSIISLQRQALPEESGVVAKATPTPAPTPARGASARKPSSAATSAAAPTEMKVERFPFHVTFTGNQSSVRAAMNALAANKEQFLIITPESITNSNDKPISRASVQSVAAAPVATPEGSGDPSQDTPLPESDAAPAASPSTTAQRLQYIVGNETVTVRLRVDMTIFDTAETTNPTDK